MEDEELEQPKNKITLSNFFESIQSIDELANNALSITNSNSNLIQEQKSLIDALSLSIEGLRGDIQEINNYITIQKNEASDKLVETQDDKQKQMISERLQGLQGEKGEKGEEGEAAQRISESESKKFKEEAEEKRQLKKFVNEVIDEREEKKENERKDELREKEDAEQKKEQSERLQNKSEGGLKASVGGLGTFDEGRSTGGQGGQGGQGGGKKKGGLLGLLTNPLALGIGALGAGASLLQLPKMLTSMVGASFGGGRGVTGAVGGAADFLTGGLFDFDGRSGGGALKKMGKGLKNMFSGKKKEENVKAEVDNLESRVDALESGDPSSKDSGKIVTTKKLKTRFDRDTGKAYVNGQEVDVQKYAEFKRLSPREQLNQGLDFFKEDPISPTEGMNEKGLKPEKKENKLMDFVKKGGVAGFLGRKLFGKKDEEENKDEDFTSKKITTKKLNTRFDQDTGKAYVNGQEVDVQKYAEFKNLPPEEQLAQGLDFFKEDSKAEEIKPEKKEKRGIKGIIGGVADSLTGGFFDFDKRGDTKFQEFQQGTADTLTGGFFDFDKKGDNKLQEFQQGTADTLTGGVFDFDKKGSNKLQRFQQGFADAMTGNLTDFDRKGGSGIVGAFSKMISNFDGRPGSRKTKDTKDKVVKKDTKDKVVKKEQSFSSKDIPEGKKTSFADALSGNRDTIHQFLFERRIESIPPGEGFNDFSGNPAYDSDVDTFIRGLENNPKGIGIEINSGRVYLSKEKSKDGGYAFSRDTKYEGVRSDNQMYGDTFPNMSFTGSKKNTFSRALLNFDQPSYLDSVVESKAKKVSQESLTSLDTSSPQIIMMPGANEQSSKKNVIAPNNPPQVKEGELKSTSSSSSFVNTISNNIIVSAKKSKSGLPPEIARMLK